MTIGQFLTTATLVAAVALLGVGGYFAWRVYFYDQFFVSAVQAGWFKTVADGDRGFVAGVLVFLTFGAAVCLLHFQQWCVGRVIERELRLMREMHREVEAALGTDAADAFLRYKTDQLSARLADPKGLGAVFG